MSDNHISQSNAPLIKSLSSSTNPIIFDNTTSLKNNSPQFTAFQNYTHYDNTNMAMNLNLNGSFLPISYVNKSHLNLNDPGNEFLYGGGSTTTRSSPMQSLCEVSSPTSSGNSKTSKQVSLPRMNRNEISPSMFETEDHFDIEEEDENKHVTKLFVGNLPTSTTLQELLVVFKKFGPVNEKLSVVKDHNYAFIHFYNRKDAQVALKEVNDSLFKDRYIRVQFSTSQDTKIDKKRPDFRNDDMLKLGQVQSNYYLNNNNSDSIYHRQETNDCGRNFNEFKGLQNYPEESNLSSFLAQSNRNGFSNGFIPIIGAKSDQSMNSNSNFYQPKTSQAKDAWDSFQMLPTNNLLIEAHKLSLQRKEQITEYEQFERQQRQNLIQILYLRQLENKKKQQEQQMNQLPRSVTLTNISPAGLLNRTSILPTNPSNNNVFTDVSSLFLDPNFLRQGYNPTTASNIMRSNTLFSFKNN